MQELHTLGKALPASRGGRLSTRTSDPPLDKLIAKPTWCPLVDRLKGPQSKQPDSPGTGSDRDRV